MHIQEQQFVRLGTRLILFVVIAALASLILSSAAPAQAKPMRVTTGPDVIVGTAKPDVIKSRGGDDRIKSRGGRDRLWGGNGRDRLSGGHGRDRLSGGHGRDRLRGGPGRDRLSGGSGRDRLSGGRGADRLNAVDGLTDGVVNGGPGKDLCRVDATDQGNLKGCETVRIVRTAAPGAPGTPGAPASPGGSGSPVGPGTGQGCAVEPEDGKLALARTAQEEVPPTFSDPFYAVTLTLGASADGLDGGALPISIEEVCDVPTALQGEAAQLIGGDGIAVVSPATLVVDAAGQQLTGAAATTALAGADTVSLRAQLERPARWGQDEDGEPVPTFSVSRADITD